MEGRKMSIVPYKLWEDMKRWKEEQIQKPRLPPDPNVSATASLQNDLSSVMANEDLSEAERSQLYVQTLYKFKTAHEKALKEQSSKLLPSLAKTTTSTHSKINQLIVDSVPKMFKRKAQLLLSILQDNPNMSWDDDGTVKLYGKPILGSNIIDLVNDVVRQRKGSEPTGWQPFAEGLRELNILQDVIGNRERWDWMHRSPNLPRRRIYHSSSKSKTGLDRSKTSKSHPHIQNQKISHKKTQRRIVFTFYITSQETTDQRTLFPTIFICHEKTYKRRTVFA